MTYAKLFEIELFDDLTVYLQNVFTNHIRGSLNKFPDFFCMGTFIDSTHMKL